MVMLPHYCYFVSITSIRIYNGDIIMHAKELLELERRDIRALHYTWIAFFLTFYVWFNMAPLATSMLQTESYLTPDHIKLFLIANVALTIKGRVIVVMKLDSYDTQRVFSIQMVVLRIPTCV